MKNISLTELFPFLCCCIKQKVDCHDHDHGKGEEIQLPELEKNEVSRANDQLDYVLEQTETDYYGTCPVEDTQTIYSDAHVANKEKMEKMIAMGKISDPFDDYGFGIVAYFKFLRHIMFAFLIITGLFVPVIGLYGQSSFYENLIGSHLVNSVSLGNLG